MDLAFRGGRLEDFAAFYDACFHRDRENAWLRGMVEHEWRVLLANRATLTMVVEDRDRPAGERLVGCAQAAFVTDTFVRWARAGVAPYVNGSVARPLPEASPALLDLDAVRDANSGDGVNALVTRWAGVDAGLDVEDAFRLREYMVRNFQFFSRGYRFKEILLPCQGTQNRDRALGTGFHLCCDYRDYFRHHPPAPAPDVYPYLTGVTRAEALEDEGRQISALFVYTPPRCYFGLRDQEVLTRALQGESDAEIAGAMWVSESGLKNWWRGIYRRAEQWHPALFAGLGRGAEGRGPERRRVLLNYVREHPEELRPVQPPQGRPERGQQ